LENIHLLKELGSDLRGKRVLDIGCGQGDTTVFFALRGAEVWALDVADRMVEFTRELAGHHGVTQRVHVEACRVEDMKYPSDFFDIVFADGVLHHLDLPRAVPNLVRVMKSGGRGFFLEPQKGSLFIQIYRVFARDLRTEDERPLEPRDVDYFTSQFSRFEHNEYHFVSLLLFGIRFVQLKVQGKAFPYWMEDIRAGKWHPRLLRRLQAIDQFLLTRLGFLRKYCWMTVIAVQK
jgi:ubiquinone/menaquinone biosynthesis C-methylase UbiE